MCCTVTIYYVMTLQRVSSENVRFSRLLTHPSLLRATKGDVDDIETSLLSQVIAEQQLGILEEEEAKKQEPKKQEAPPSSPLPSKVKVKRKEMKWEPQQQGEVTDKEVTDKEVTDKEVTVEDIHMKRQQEERSEAKGDNATESKEAVTVELQDNDSSVTTDKQQQKENTDSKVAIGTPTVLFKQLKQQYQSITEKLKEHEERELARRATLESRKKDAAQLREARQSQKTTVVTSNDKSEVEEEEAGKEIVIQLDQMGSYAAFNDVHHDNITMTTHKRHTQTLQSSVGDDEYYQQMNNNSSSSNTHLASKAT